MIKIKDSVEFITISLLRHIDTIKKMSESVAIEIPTDDEFVAQFSRYPLKDESQRLLMALNLKGVKEVIMEGRTFRCDEEIQISKKYNLGYVPGTYDLFHCGHIRNVVEARKMCKMVCVGINSDELVYANKKKITRQTARTRSFIAEHISGIDFVFITESNDKGKANQIIQQHFNRSFDALFLGADLKQKDSINKMGLDPNIDIIYTERTEEEMKVFSSTTEREKLNKLEQEIACLRQENLMLRKTLQEISEQI